ncbi:LOB domain-containing protein 27-like [Tripterygium wilfordii]|uniref:LOB domain-containing protein 27-like n=1 Tax=Tripterygium wilfordii TaxID=458696 RepID=A0A7J7CN43_TRIWF|nr:protein ASYMMETRIC LEAVES 2-like [Tripterygium wilfordii]KAF5735512.1 LOB domain-containing protein 27-like [Tripterygium wilfordii]
MTIKGGTSQACAACKYQRRRCSKDCALAPYFPADQPKKFQNAHRLYGVSNILRVLKRVHPNQKEEAMGSIIYESNMRARFPVYGCLWVIGELERQFNQAMEELRYVTTRLAVCKDQYCYQMPPPSPSSLGIGMSNEVVPVYGQNHHHHHNHPGVATMAPLSPNDFMVNGNNGIGGMFVESNDHDMMNPVRTTQQQQQQQQQHGFYNNAIPIQSPFMVPQGFPLQQETEVSHDYDDIPFDTIADDRQSYIESKESCESSAESRLKDTTQSIQHVTENELRTAAACLTLTGVN